MMSNLQCCPPYTDVRPILYPPYTYVISILISSLYRCPPYIGREKHNLEKFSNISVKETVDGKSLNHTNASEVIEEESSNNVSVKESLD